jgi:hypothetical protein
MACWVGLSYAAVSSGAAAEVIAIGAVSLVTCVLLLSVWAVATGKRLVRSATRPQAVDEMNRVAELITSQ